MLVDQAKTSIIRDFDDIVREHNAELRSFLYRFTTSRQDAEDIAQDTFIKAYEKIDQFRGKSSFKTWLFSIAVNLAKDNLRAKKRWTTYAQDNCKSMIGSTPRLAKELHEINATSPNGCYEVNEHIDFCFTCISKSLVIEQQLALMLADIYEFKVKDISNILGKSIGTVKHLLRDARATMGSIFEQRCSLINKNGVCYQCSELNGFNNNKADTQRLLAKHELNNASNDSTKKDLFRIRTQLIKAIDPLESRGADLHNFLLEMTHKANS